MRFARRRFFLLQFKVFFLSGSTRSIPNVGKWCFSQFKFRYLPVLPPLFAYLNKLNRSPSITLWYSSVLILKRQVVFVFICLKIATFCLQILIRCCQKQTVWHWRARHQPKVYTISNYPYKRRNAAAALQQFTFMVAQRLSVCKAVLVSR